MGFASVVFNEGNLVLELSVGVDRRDMRSIYLWG